MIRQGQTEEFKELADCTQEHEKHRGVDARRNVVKRAQVVRKGIEEVGLEERSAEDPMIYVQRDGDRVTGVDFQCKCGRSASLRLEYDEE